MFRPIFITIANRLFGYVSQVTNSMKALGPVVWFGIAIFGVEALFTRRLKTFLIMAVISTFCRSFNVAADETGWNLKFKEPFRCKIKYGRTNYLRYGKSGNLPRPLGGPKGRNTWDCYQYMNQRHEFGYSFSTHGMNRKYFLIVAKGVHKVRFANDTVFAEDAEDSKIVSDKIIFVHKNDEMLGKDVLRVTISGEEGCFLHVWKRQLVKKCVGNPRDDSHFKICPVNQIVC